MAGKGSAKATRGKRRTGPADADRTRLRRFLFLWAPIIIVVLIGLYAAALDPARPTGRTVEVSVIGKEETSGGQSSTAMFRVRLENGEEAVMFIPERQVPPPPGRVLAEEYTTSILRKRTYRYLRTLTGVGHPTTP